MRLNKSIQCERCDGLGWIRSPSHEGWGDRCLGCGGSGRWSPYSFARRHGIARETVLNVLELPETWRGARIALRILRACIKDGALEETRSSRGSELDLAQSCSMS